MRKICSWLDSNKEIILKIIGETAVFSIVVTIVGGIVANYISQQRYYDDLLDKYLNSMENLLIKDDLHVNYLEEKRLYKEKQELYKKILNKHDENTNKQFEQKEAQYNQKKAKYDQVKNLALSVTENTLRSLSKNDGICLPESLYFKSWSPKSWSVVEFCCLGTKHNPERRQLLLSFLQQSKLGFINLSGERPEQPAESFLEGINLSSMSDAKKVLENLDLEKIQLDRAILRKANFTQANLRNAHLNAADLTDAFLKQTDLSGADLTKTNLRNAALNKATLKGTNLQRANLIDADLTGVKFKDGINFKGAVYGCFVTRGECWYKKSNNETKELIDKLQNEAIEVKRGLDLSNLPPKTRKALDEVFKKDPHQDKTLLAFIDTDLSGVDLTGAKLVNADLRKTDFTKAILKDANLTNANLTGANLTNADLTGANLKGAKGAAINQAKLCNTILPSGKISVCLKKDS